jgi:hypothetical protein
MLDGPTNQLIVATDRIAGEVTLLLVDPNIFAVHGAAGFPTQWREGPPLITQADRTTLPRPTCDSLEVGIIVAKGPKPDPWTWDLALSIGTFKISPRMH